jgi:hypothetical protein
MVRRRLWGRVVRTLAVTALLAVPVCARGDIRCPGDCNGDGRVSISEVITVIRMNFGELPTDACPNGVRQDRADNVDVVCALRTALFSVCENCPP